MDFKINQMRQINTDMATKNTNEVSDGTFKFTLASQIEEADLQARLTVMMEEITQQGKRIGKRMDIRDMKQYRTLIQEFLNEVVTRSHKFSRENFLDRRGRHRV